MQRIEKELQILNENSQNRKIPLINKKINNLLVIDNKEYINFASNDYLSISTNNSLREELKQDK